MRRKLAGLEAVRLPIHSAQGRIQGFGMGGTKLARAKILLINIHYSLKPIDFIAQTSAESSTTRYASPFAYAICMQAKVFAVQGHSYCITGVATNNYSMNFNYLAARGGGTGPRFPPPGSATGAG